MAGTRDYLFNPQALYNLLIHYTDGQVPMNGEVVGMVNSELLPRKIGLVVRSDEWEESTPLHLGYDGRRTMSWSKGMGGDPVWSQREETPRRQ